MKGARFFTLAVMLALITIAPTAYSADEATEVRELERIKHELNEKKKKIKQAGRKERSILSELEKIDREIQLGSAELTEQRKQLHEAETGLRELEQRNADINRELALLKNIYGRRLRALYKMGRSGYAAAALTSDGQGGMVKRIKYLGVITNRDHTLIRDYGNALERLVVRQAELAEKKQDFFARERTVELKRSEYEARKRKKTGLLAGVRQEKGLYEHTLRELEESSVTLWAMIKKDEQERKAVKAARPAAGTESASRNEGNRLSWPLEGQVLTRFGMQRHPRFGTVVFRRGIEIGAREGESVRAVEAGQAAYADWYKGYGKLIILDHGAGFFTLYGNLSRLNLAKGEQVAKGQVIGLAGETGSLKGSKLYFEIRRNGEAQDPLTWLAKK